MDESHKSRYRRSRGVIKEKKKHTSFAVTSLRYLAFLLIQVFCLMKWRVHWYVCIIVVQFLNCKYIWRNVFKSQLFCVFLSMGFVCLLNTTIMQTRLNFSALRTSTLDLFVISKEIVQGLVKVTCFCFILYSNIVKYLWISY